MRCYHEALNAETHGAGVVLAAQTLKIAEATTATEIETANAAISIEFNRLGTETLAAADDLPADAVAALTGVNSCGHIAN
jgi:hypothetical protein